MWKACHVARRPVDEGLSLGVLNDLTPALCLVTGSLPASIANLVNLRSLICQGNALTGTLPFALGHLPNLMYLGLSSNYFRGAVPSSLEGSSSLRQLVLAYNQFTSVPWGSMDSAAGCSLWVADFHTNAIQVIAARVTMYALLRILFT